MEQKTGYVLLDANNNIIETWNQNVIPNIIILPNGNHIHAPSIGNYFNYKFVEKWLISNTSPDIISDGITESFDGTKYIITTQYRLPTQQELLSRSANIRFSIETNGIIISNNEIYTDRQSQSMITGIVTLMNLQPNTIIEFKTGNGFIEANNSIINNIANCVANHIQTCFKMESTIADKIKTNTITKYSEIENLYASININFN